MQKIIIKNILTILFGILFVAGSSFSQQIKARDAEPLDGPIKKNIAEGAKLFESIEVETLNELQKLGVAAFVPEPVMNTSTEDYKVSLNLGISVADAISCAISKDKAKFLKYAKIIHEYGERLDVKQVILVKYDEITKAADKYEWENVKNLLYDLKDDITAELHSPTMDKKDEAVLAMASGWLEGLYIVAKSLDKHFSEDARKLLRDRDFVRYLSENLHSLDAENKNKKEVKAMIDALPKIDEIINKPPDYSYKKEDVRKILQISEPLRKIIVM
jgi:hypothetical protein